MIHLEKIDSSNIWEIVDLKVFRAQKNFVAENWVSIVQAYGVRDSATKAFPFAIYNDNIVVINKEYGCIYFCAVNRNRATRN